VIEECRRVNAARPLKRALGDWPLAIASGITPENVGEYLPVADCFLVATGSATRSASWTWQG
jgi:hypothetical protein